MPLVRRTDGTQAQPKEEATLIPLMNSPRHRVDHPRRRGPRFATLTLAALAASLATACASAPDAATPARARAAPGPQEPSPRLPPIPAVDGPLDLRVSYPRDSAFVSTRGRTFIFGSAGTRQARVWINDQQVDVQPNGGFLAFLPVPDDGVYRLRAEAGGRTATLEVPVRLPDPAPPLGDSAAIVPGSVHPSGGWAALPGERIDVGFQAPAGGSARLILPGGTIVPLTEDRRTGGGATDFGVAPGADPDDPDRPGPLLSWYRGSFTARPLMSPDTAVPWPALAGARPLPVADSLAGQPAAPAVLELGLAGDTLRQPLAFNLALLDPARPRVGMGYDPEGPVVARPGPGGGPYHYVWADGTELTLTGERGGAYRVRLAEDLDAWAPAGDVRLLVPGTTPPESRVATVRMDPQPGYIDIHLALDRRLPYQVDETDTSLSLTVFGALSQVNYLQHGRTDPFIVRGEWSQPTNERFVLTVHTAAAPWGYETFWADGDDLVLRLRRPPAIDASRPLRGVVVGVDAGHGGADRFTMGPTGFTEADANLGIALALKDALEARGARVEMTRMTDTTLSLVERTDFARNRNVDLLVSVHNNAFPDGVNPWENNGTSVYYNHPRAASLAWSVQEELLAELGLRDIGVGRADLHLPRLTWAPSILTENMFMMIPAQEAALKQETVQRRIAEAHARGIEGWLRAYADSRPGPGAGGARP